MPDQTPDYVPPPRAPAPDSSSASWWPLFSSLSCAALACSELGSLAFKPWMSRFNRPINQPQPIEVAPQPNRQPRRPLTSPATPAP